MSIQNEIRRISANISAAYGAVEEMGGGLPGKQNSTNLAAAIQGIATGGSAGVTNPNLLDNWYFVDPINQRGETTYIGTRYTIDRWHSTSDNLTVALKDDCINLSTPSNGYFRHDIEHPIKSRVTLSALVRGAGSVYLIARSIGGPNASKSFDITDANSWQLISFSAEPSDYNAEGFDQFIIRIFGNVSIDICAAKLELGDTQTLAHQENGNWVLNDPPPNSSLELAKCQRYFIRLNQSKSSESGTFSLAPYYAKYKTLYATIGLPVSLRANPTVTMYGNYDIIDTSGGTDVRVPAESVSLWRKEATGVCLAFKSSSALTAGRVYSFDSGDDGAYIDLSCDL